MPTEATAFLDDLTAKDEAKPASKSVVAPAQPQKREPLPQEGQPPEPSERRSVARKRATTKYDLRQENATERDIQFSTRIDDDVNERIRIYCIRRKRGLKRKNQRYGLGEFLEDAIEALERDLDTVIIDGREK